MISAVLFSRRDMFSLYLTSFSLTGLHTMSLFLQYVSVLIYPNYRPRFVNQCRKSQLVNLSFTTLIIYMFEKITWFWLVKSNVSTWMCRNMFVKLKSVVFLLKSIVNCLQKCVVCNFMQLQSQSSNKPIKCRSFYGNDGGMNCPCTHELSQANKPIEMQKFL